MAGADLYEEQYLYDLQADPYELNNLVGHESHREVAQVMRERLLRRMEEAGEARPPHQRGRAAPLGPAEGQP